MLIKEKNIRRILLFPKEKIKDLEKAVQETEEWLRSVYEDDETGWSGHVRKSPKDSVDRAQNEIDRSSLYNGKKLVQYLKLSIQPRFLNEQGQVEFC